MFGYKILWNVSRTNLRRLGIRKISHRTWLSSWCHSDFKTVESNIWILALKDTATRTDRWKLWTAKKKKMWVTYKEFLTDHNMATHTPSSTVSDQMTFCEVRVEEGEGQSVSQNWWPCNQSHNQELRDEAKLLLRSVSSGRGPCLVEIPAKASRK